MNQSTPDPWVIPHSPLIDAYMADLENALRAAEPSERDEVLMTVREHIAASLHEKDGPNTAKDVEAVLAGLGSVDQLAGGLDYGAMPVQPAGTQPPGRPHWFGYGVLAAGALSLPLITFQPPAAILIALLALILGIIGSREHEGSDKRPYRAGAALGGLTLSILVVALLGLLGTGSGSSEIPLR